jgi:hypothetical protein
MSLCFGACARRLIRAALRAIGAEEDYMTGAAQNLRALYEQAGLPSLRLRGIPRAVSRLNDIGPMEVEGRLGPAAALGG